MSNISEIYDPASSQVVTDPYPIYRQLREQDPVHWHEGLEAWILTRYSEVVLALKDSRLSAGGGRIDAMFRRFSPIERSSFSLLEESLRLWSFYSDPPSHTKIRSAMGKYFTPSIVQGLRSRVEANTQALLAKVKKQEVEFDVIRDFANPLPIIIINELLGLPASDRDKIKAWSDAIAGFITSVQHNPAVAQTAQDAMQEMGSYLEKEVAARRKNPTEDVLTYLANHEHEGQRLSRGEILATATMLLFGGHETTTNLIGNGVLAFLSFPGQWDLLRARPELAANVPDEILRFDSPVQIMGRIAKGDFEIGGRRIKGGQRLFCMLGAANRDPAEFENPDSFYRTIRRGRHLGFGQGLHYCVGASLARLEGAVAFSHLAKLLPRLKLTERGIERQAQMTLRGLKWLSLEVS